ncbi:non-ribosomal peptide synthetase [Leptolinea tardivitalis]|uniref:Carrier domain-containing protein n=1 Tax=Leptolinea tardivitalis TaxID=229920 RepID=A0A0P6WZM0_9CHLR|nr:amino acid adenylation domain-containing protein [Leptolinea tardivitalis]KPL74016.1 hypothetical protein ADM99_01920 [Leptolinea tardivitalis]GAP22654.1 protein containing amino acid adenylation domain [Leptolinea tardivitalis]
MASIPSTLRLTDLEKSAIVRYCQTNSISLMQLLVAAFSALLYRYTGNENIALTGCGTAEQTDEKPTIISLSDDTLFSGLLDQFRPFAEANSTAMEQVIHSDQGFDLILHDLTKNWSVGIQKTAGINPFITADEAAGHLSVLLQGITSTESLSVIRYPLLTHDEWDKIIHQWNNTESALPESETTIHQHIARQVHLTPDNTAIQEEYRKATYRELWGYACRMAEKLKLEGITSGQIIGLNFESSIEMIGSMLAVMMNGAAFVLLDPAQPDARTNLILKEADVRFLVSGQIKPSSLRDQEIKIIEPIDFSSESFNHDPDQNQIPENPVSPADICFILFTSGSTGKPKGVLHTHRNIINRFYSLMGNVPMTETDVFVQSSPLSSIDAIDEILFPLFWGASTSIVSGGAVKDPRLLVQILEKRAVTHILLVPSLLRMILEITEDVETRLKRLTNWIIGGEMLEEALSQEFHRQLPHARLINYYGLTEGDGTLFDTGKAHPFSSNPPIGRAAPNVRVYLLNSALQPVPVGVIGEICIGGNGIARGYLNLPEINAQRFIDDLFVPGDNNKLFRTGDLGRYLPDGNIEYMGRKDFQVKIRGFRVELQEVEGEIRQHPAVKEVVVVPYKSPNQQTGFDRLVAYIVRQSGHTESGKEIRDFLESRLPEYAIPAFIIPMEAFPLNPNGKVDRKQLPEPQIEQIQKDTVIIPPKDQTEEKLLKIWEEILGIHPISTNDSVFDLGGDSLSVICILVQVESEFGRDLPIDIIFQADTVAKLAEILRGEKTQGTWSSLVPIQVKGTKHPLYCVHADGGVLIYRSIAKLLGEDYPVYGLQAQGLDGKTEPLGSVEEIAGHYITEMRTVQPHGPYHLCGFSLGGAFIYEMARQLREAGEEVRLVAFFDAGSPDYPKFPRQSAKIWHKISVHLISLGLKNMREKFVYFSHRTKDRLQVTFFPIIGAVMQKLNMTMPHSVRYIVVRQTLLDAVDRYHLKGYSGDIVVFKAKLQPEGCIPDPTMGWGKYVTGDIKIIEIEGNHNTMMKDRYLNMVVDKLRELIL